MKNLLQMWEKERHEALKSLDEGMIKSFYKKYDYSYTNDEELWIAIHKARIYDKNMPLNKQKESIKWLKDRVISVDVMG